MTFTILIIFIPVLISILFLLNLLFAPSRPDPQKESVYECGFISFHQTRSVFNISFYLVGILFLIFDLEVALIYPLAISLNSLNLYGF
jgi:NADH:ubiquinone oxidoreductase subunit 3 (subunit A)